MGQYSKKGRDGLPNLTGVIVARCIREGENLTIEGGGDLLCGKR